MKTETDELIRRLKRNDSVAAKKLIKLYESTIKHIALVIYDRYRLPDIEEVFEESKQIFLILAATDFDNTIATFNTYINHFLHAGMVARFRPASRWLVRNLPLRSNVKVATAEDIVTMQDRKEVVRKLNNYMWMKLDDRELDLVVNHMVEGVSRRKIAERWRVSPTRVEQVYRRVVSKLKVYLRSVGVEGMEDI